MQRSVLINAHCTAGVALVSSLYVPYTLKFSRGQYFADWLKKLKNEIFAGV